MSQRSGVTGFVQQDRPAGDGPRRVYFIEESAGVYVPAVGSIGEADAYLMEESTDVFVLADASTDEDRVAMLVNTSTVLV
jgi:hypothetical protein